MIAKEIKFVDYDGNERIETFRFHMTESELMELENSVDGGFSAMIKEIINKKDIPGIVNLFKKIIVASYGVKSADGRRFIKNKEVLEEFTQTEAFSVLYMELATDAEKAAEFINGVTSRTSQIVKTTSPAGVTPPTATPTPTAVEN